MKDGIINGGGSLKMKNNQRVFILNKPFEGSYTNQEGNVAHEIINYFKTDGGDRIFIYNNPYGQCPSGIEFDGQNKCTIEYMLFAKNATMDTIEGEDKSSTFYLTHLIKIKKLLHTYSAGKKHLKDSQAKIKELIKDNEIIYGGKLLNEIYGDNDETLYVTFEAEKIYVPKDGVPIEVCTPGYRFQRNKGYVFSEDNKKAFEALSKKTNLSLWKDVTKDIKPIDVSTPTKIKKQTFLDLILKDDSEECYTNMLFHVLKWKNTIRRFSLEFSNSTIDDVVFDVQREFPIPGSEVFKGGRTDVCALSENQRIVIENKVFSGLNGVSCSNGSRRTQLSVYYEWADKKNNPICFIACPGFREDDIKNEMALEPGIESKYIFVSYKQISEFIEKLDEMGGYFDGFPFKNYIKDIISAFGRFDYKTKTSLFEQFFVEAIKRTPKI